MKKIFLISLALFFFSCGYVAGQFQVTAYFNPQPGETQTLIYGDTTGIFPGNGGANQNWNFSGVINSGDTSIQNYVLPSSTPYGSSFPTATIASNTPINPSSYTYYSGTSSVFELLGSQNSSFKMIGVDPKKFRIYPFNYLQSFSDTYRGLVYQGYNIVQMSSGNVTVTYDGYGTLVLPSGTATNVGRFKFVSYEVDSMDFGSGIIIEYIKDTTWVWSKSNYRFALLQIEKSWISMDGINYSGFKWVGYTPNINSVGIKPVSNEIPSEFKLEQNYPNPFNPITTIRYHIPKNTFVTLKIFDGLGREIAALCNCNHNAGSYEISWDASEYSSGIYYCKMITNEFVDTKRVILIK